MLQKAMWILEAFRPSGGPFRLAELVERSGLTKTTVHRLSAELVEIGLLERVAVGYRLGPKLFELGAIVPPRRDLRDAARPFMQDLFEATRETVHLAARDGLDAVYVEKIHGRDRREMPSQVGGALPLTCTGVGKALLAFGGEELLAEVLSRPLRVLTPNSLRDPERLRIEIEQVQIAGIAYEQQESMPGLSCVAVPVLVDGLAVAALSVSVPVARFRPSRLAPALRAASFGVARALAP
ncbi:transcriptional regulator, IclR family [Parafrankia sp. EAN1pec]|uniref:IclR family transcriptional regulator n=1 Tax=Parafrankia sp. (strain EAN1pec) TaxID=298653 RepID=UPI000054414C|nr:transcriptional regulator, IclR family [Frankia sp. EAN1pec]